MVKQIKTEVLKDLDKVLGTKGTKTGIKPLTDDIYNKVKNNKVA